MGYYAQHKDFYNQPIRLDNQQLEEPFDVIQSFCGAYQLHEIRQHLWDFLETAVITENFAFDEADKRNSIFLFYQQLEEALEALYIINSIKTNSEIKERIR